MRLNATRRELLLSLICTATARHHDQPLSPATFPWAVDRTAHLARREVLCEYGNDRGELNFVLARLHRALSVYHATPSWHAMFAARRQLMRLKTHIEIAGVPAGWHEMHLFAAILLRNTFWHVV
jgi:hypothetical protein